MKKAFIILAATTALFSCKKDKDNDNFYKGAEVEVHHGKGWSSILLDDQGAPLALTISLNEAALNTVPVGSGQGGGEHHTHDNNLVLPLPSQALSATPFKTIGLDWNPAGHPPANIYTAPHFDFHFYLVTEAERLAATDPAKLNANPATDYLPANHIGADPVPQMGKHWVDITSPELNPTNPSPFTQTFIYGSYDSKVTFYEPMITLAFLKATQHFVRDIPQPSKVQQSGYYPTKMSITKDKGLTNVSLTDFRYRTAS